jgi:glycosyltransferase involved in cell wall biosynthesis
MIFVDDASDDGGSTWELLSEFERAYPENVIILHLDENLRQGGARNAAIPYATGEYISFVDADDFVAEDIYEKAYARASCNNADIVQFDFKYYTERLGAIDSRNNYTDQSIVISSEEDRKHFLLSEKITYGCWNKLYKRSLIMEAGVGFAEHVIYEEPLFVYPLLYYGNRFEIMSDALYFYRQNESGTMRKDMTDMNTLMMHADVQFAVWEFMKKTPFINDFYEEIKLYFLHTYFYETMLFGVQRGFGISLELYRKLRETVVKEVGDISNSPYEDMIPKQIELYRLGDDLHDGELRSRLEKIFAV